MKVFIDKIVFGGDGMAKMSGKPVFVPYTIDNETVEIEIVKQHKDFDEAILKDVLIASENRVKPKCPLFGKCGGCQWQHINYEYQLVLKKRIVEETWERIAKRKIKVLDVIASPKKWHYRNRVQLHVDGFGNVGFKQRASSKVINVETCYIADERLNEMLAQKREGMVFFSKGLSLNIDEDRDTEGSFAQVNTLQNENLKKMVVSFIADSGAQSILELFAGSGNLTFEVAKHVKKIIASDIDKKAVEFGNARAKEKSIGNVEFVWGSSNKVVENIKQKIDLVLLDPPRTGAMESLLGIINLRPKNIVYVSCNPSTLARDSKVLFEHGYEIKVCQPIDMFPQTFHVENVVMYDLTQN